MRTKYANSLFLSVGICLLAMAAVTTAQTSSSSPASGSNGINGTTVTSSIEVGGRWVSTNGDHEKYKSDLNYRSGFRLFDSSVLIENDSNNNSIFDSALFQGSGWGADPTSSFRANIEKTGFYRVDANVRRNSYYNNLKNFAPNSLTPVSLGSWHRFDTKRNFGDVDLTIFPGSPKFRMTFGVSFNDNDGPGFYSIRFPTFSSPTTTARGDEFAPFVDYKNKAYDFRAGVGGKLLGFNVELNYGHRRFKDDTTFFINSFDPGMDPGPTTATIDTFRRDYGTEGTTNYVNLSFQRTFAERFDVTGRVVHSEVNSDIREFDRARGTSSASGASIPRILIDLDEISFTGKVTRPQTRADLGLTWRATDRFRISNTFTYDQFNIGGQNRLFETLISRTTAGVPRPDDYSNTTNFRTTNYDRYSNLIEADYQVNDRLGFFLGYRFTHREVHLEGFNLNLRTGARSLTGEEGENSTNTVIGGTRFKPTRNWAIFANFEKGESDNVFSRLENNDYFSFKVRSRSSFNNFGLNLQAMVRNNDNPGTTRAITGSTPFPETQAIAESRQRYFSGSLDWTPNREWTFNVGYTYHHQDSEVDVLVPVGAPVFPSTRFLLGKSQYYVRNGFFHFDVTARPVKWLTAYLAYRIDDDQGQGDRVGNPEDIISSYPMRFQTPEARLSFRLHPNVDWNIGYQYYSYKEDWRPYPYMRPGLGTFQIFPQQNYNAHMPYTSLRFYFGREKSAR